MFQLGPSTSSVDDDDPLTNDTPGAGAKTLLKASLDRAAKQRVLFVPGQMARVLSPEEAERLRREEEELLMSCSSGRPSLEQDNAPQTEEQDDAPGDWETDEEEHSLTSSCVAGACVKREPRPFKRSRVLLRTAQSLSKGDGERVHHQLRPRTLNNKGSTILPVTVPLLSDLARAPASLSAPAQIHTDGSNANPSFVRSSGGPSTITNACTEPVPELVFARRPTTTRQSSLGGTFNQLYAGDVQAKREQAMRIRHWQRDSASRRGSRQNSRSSSSTDLASMATVTSQLSSTECVDSPVSTTSDEGKHGEEDRDVVCDAFEVSVFASPGSNSATSLSRSSASSVFWSAQSASPAPSPLSPALSSDDAELCSSPPKSCAVDGYTTPRASARVAPFRPTFPVTSLSAVPTPVMSRASSRARPQSSSPVWSKPRAEDDVVAAFNRLATAELSAVQGDEIDRDQRKVRARSRQTSFASSSASGYSTPMRASELSIPLTATEQRNRQEALATLGLDAQGQPCPTQSSVMLNIKKILGF
ncbi:hypothetical protein OIV83_005512 [Microbotryomycetes sp. JL201]|nr:hypothetical protein OIV83_005512 [Microbotryomycetes sp. JL201]